MDVKVMELRSPLTFLLGLMLMLSFVPDLPNALAADQYPPPQAQGDFIGLWELPQNQPPFYPPVYSNAHFRDVVLDSDGNMYTASGFSGPSFAVKKLSPKGDLISFWGPQGSGPGQFGGGGTEIEVFSPSSGITWVYVLDIFNCRIQRFSSSGELLGFFGGCGSGIGLFESGAFLRGLAISPFTGNVYVADTNGGAGGIIMMFDMFGNFIHEWPAPVSASSPFTTSLAVDPQSGDVWAALSLGNFGTISTIARFSPDGTLLLSTFSVRGDTCPSGGPAGSDNGVTEIVVNSGAVFVMNGGRTRLEKYNLQGTCLLHWAAPTGGTPTLHPLLPGEGEIAHGSYGLALGLGGHILVAQDSWIREWTDAGAHVRTIWKPDGKYGALAVDGLRDTVYVSEFAWIRRYDLAGHMKGYWTQNGVSGGLPPSVPCGFGPARLTVEQSSGDVYALMGSGCGGGFVRRFASSGVVLRDYGRPCFASGPDPCTGAPDEVAAPRGVVVDGSGNVYVSQQNSVGGNRVTKFSPSGTVLNVWGVTGTEPGQLNFDGSPTQGKLRIGPDGNLYIIDKGPSDNRIQVFNLDGTLVRVWPTFVDANPPFGYSGAIFAQSIAFRPDPVEGFRAYVAGLQPTIRGHVTTVSVFRLDGSFSRKVLTPPQNAIFGSFDIELFDIDFDLQGDLYLCDITVTTFGVAYGRVSRWTPLIVNTPPRVTSLTASPASEGTPVTLTVTAVDDQGDPLTYSFDFNSDGIFDQVGPENIVSFTWGDDHTGVVTVVVSDGRLSRQETTFVMIPNVTPQAVLIGGGATEGHPISIPYQITDPGSDDVSATIAWGDGLIEQRSFPIADAPDPVESTDINPRFITDTFTHIFGDNGAYPTMVTLCDDDAGCDTENLTIIVNNVAPTVTLTLPPPGSVSSIGTPVTFSGSFTDPGTSDTHTAQWVLTSFTGTLLFPGTVTEATGSGTVTDTLIINAPGVYAIKLTVIDDDGGIGTATTIGELAAMIVVYDPADGYVTGGGWIDSPAGAYTIDPTATGRASFGFISKYQNGAQTPTGQTEFRFRAGNLNFHSSNYEWLVCGGGRCQYKGTGTINNEGNYGFLLTVIDGQIDGSGIDKFRIKIWDIATGNVIYDNQIGAGDEERPNTAIEGGSITIHRA